MCNTSYLFRYDNDELKGLYLTVCSTINSLERAVNRCVPGAESPLLLSVRVDELEKMYSHKIAIFSEATLRRGILLTV